MVHTQSVNYLVAVAAGTTFSSADLVRLRIELVAYAVAALMVLLVAMALSVYKPQGRTRYGWRKQHEQRVLSQP